MAVVGHAQMKPYFYSGKSIDNADPDELAKLLSIAEMMVDYFDSVYQQKDCLTPATFIGKGEYMRELYATSQILQMYLEGKDEWYDRNFLSYLRKNPVNLVSLPAQSNTSLDRSGDSSFRK